MVLEVEQLLTSTMILREVKVQRGGELSVTGFSLQSFASLLEGSHVKWFTDSQVAAKIVEVGSMKSGLHKMARRI